MKLIYIIAGGLALHILTRGRYTAKYRNLVNRVINIARGEVGVAESPPGSNWGPEIAKYGGEKGDNWCCWFITWVWKKAGLNVPSEGAVARLQEWAKKHGRYWPKSVLITDDMRGWAIVYRYNGAGHIGIIVEALDNNSRFITIEGNKNNAVRLWERDISDPNMVGYINPFPR